MRKILRDIRREFAIPIVLVSHDMFEACTMADTMIIYTGGRIVQTGAPLEILRSPVAHDVAALFNLSGSARPSADAFSLRR